MFRITFTSATNRKSLLLLQNCFSDRKKASNLEAYVDWFNRLSYLVATEICLVSEKDCYLFVFLIINMKAT